MLSCENRLVEKDDFEKVYRLGTVFCWNDIFIKAYRNEKKETRIGFSIGIKFSKKAVERNRIKRQLRGIVRKNIENLKKGFDVVIMVKKKEKSQFTSSELKEDLLGAFEKGNLLTLKK